MRTARAFRRAGAEVQVGQFYLDAQTNEPREIDVIATIRGLHIGASFSVECKSSKRPWVVLTTPSPLSDLFLTHRVFHSSWDSVVNGKLQSWNTARASIDATQTVAYNASRVAFGGNDTGSADTVFPSIMAATKAAYWYANSTKRSQPERAHIVFPVIATDAPLFACWLPDDSDEIELDLISGGIPLRWARPLGGGKMTMIDLVNSEGLDLYAQDCRVMVHELGEEMRFGLPPN